MGDFIKKIADNTKNQLLKMGDKLVATRHIRHAPIALNQKTNENEKASQTNLVAETKNISEEKKTEYSGNALKKGTNILDTNSSYVEPKHFVSNSFLKDRIDSFGSAEYKKDHTESEIAEFRESSFEFFVRFRNACGTGDYTKISEVYAEIFNRDVEIFFIGNTVDFCNEIVSKAFDQKIIKIKPNFHKAHDLILERLGITKDQKLPNLSYENVDLGTKSFLQRTTEMLVARGFSIQTKNQVIVTFDRSLDLVIEERGLQDYTIYNFSGQTNPDILEIDVDNKYIVCFDVKTMISTKAFYAHQSEFGKLYFVGNFKHNQQYTDANYKAIMAAVDKIEKTLQRSDISLETRGFLNFQKEKLLSGKVDPNNVFSERKQTLSKMIDNVFVTSKPVSIEEDIQKQVD